MIRPVTILCAVMAAVSGLFLYAKKHDTLLLDQEITTLVNDTHTVQEQTVMLRTQWALLNQPDRLSVLSERLLPDLNIIHPQQFVTLDKLDSRLPAFHRTTVRKVMARNTPVMPPVAKPVVLRPPPPSTTTITSNILTAPIKKEAPSIPHAPSNIPHAPSKTEVKQVAVTTPPVTIKKPKLEADFPKTATIRRPHTSEAYDNNSSLEQTIALMTERSKEKHRMQQTSHLKSEHNIAHTENPSSLPKVEAVSWSKKNDAHTLKENNHLITPDALSPLPAPMPLTN